MVLSPTVSNFSFSSKRKKMDSVAVVGSGKRNGSAFATADCSYGVREIKNRVRERALNHNYDFLSHY